MPVNMQEHAGDPLENMPAINRVDTNAELDQRIQLLELQMIVIMKDRASSSADPATEQLDVTNSDETIDVNDEKTDFGPRATSPRRPRRKQHRPPLNSGKDINSEVSVPDDSGLANGNIAIGTADKEPSYKSTLLNNLSHTWT